MTLYQFSNADFSIYSNQAYNVLNFKFNENTNQFKSVQIFDLAGRIVLTDAIFNQSINIKSLPNGTYFLMLKDNDGKQLSQKFVKE